MIDICVIGAGIAGLSAARKLKRDGYGVVVLDKSRGYGGRAATRRIAGNRVDHGAQYFTVRDDQFRQTVDAWLGHVAVWTRGFHRLHESGRLEDPTEGHPRYICPEGMNTLGKLLAAGLETRVQARATGVTPEAGGWRIDIDGGVSLTARQVLICTPADQALGLLGEHASTHVTAALSAVTFEPCWAVMAGYGREIAPDWRGVHLIENPVTSWAAHDSSKRTDPPETVLVLHSNPEFARTHERAAAPTVVPRMLAAASALGDWIERPLWTDHQRWRYALVTHSHADPYIEAAAGLFLCGDWCGGARLEAAYLSGLAVAAAAQQHAGPGESRV